MLYQSKDNTLNAQKPGQGDRSADCTRNCKQQYVKLRIATLKVGTMRGRSVEIVEMLPRCNVDICCIGRANRIKKLWEITVIISSSGREMIWDMVA